MIAGQGLKALQSKLHKTTTSDNVESDPSIINAIITAIVQLISGCFSPTPYALRRRLGNRVRLANAIHREAASLSWEESFFKADELFALADQASNADLQAIIDDCCHP